MIGGPSSARHGPVSAAVVADEVDVATLGAPLAGTAGTGRFQQVGQRRPAAAGIDDEIAVDPLPAVGHDASDVDRRVRAGLGDESMDGDATSDLHPRLGSRGLGERGLEERTPGRDRVEALVARPVAARHGVRQGEQAVRPRRTGGDQRIADVGKLGLEHPREAGHEPVR